jgi:hypothetical protein
VIAVNCSSDGSSFDSRRNAKASEGANDVADAEAPAANEPELFGEVAAE